MEKKIIMGVDPGTRITGYGILHIENSRYTPLDFGCIRPPPTLPLSERYLIIFEGIEALLHKYQPTAIAVESQFIKKNAQSAIKLGMAKGMIILAAARKSIPIFEYAPRAAKLAVAGNGRADKLQVQRMIQVILGLSSLPTPEDAADGLALAICHAHHEKNLSLFPPRNRYVRTS
ncbi:MAG: crossover junction endodeoxyribonuclease RuvC [Chlamydiota bacterium]